MFIDGAVFAGMQGEGGLAGGAAFAACGKIVNTVRQKNDGKIILPRVFLRREDCGCDANILVLYLLYLSFGNWDPCHL